ncbi:MAG: S8 family serine peptidase, partial [Streptomycetaceae bacterium]|nr:S8 family serine peptidase [Streptomycetaceae bacterium]
DSQAQIINISIAGTVNYPDKAAAVQYALDRGKLVVAGSGNASENGRVPVYPAAYPGVLGVGAVDQDGRTWSDSNQGSWVSIAAPGTRIASACTEPTRYCLSDGTSDATALTSGVAALVWSAHPDWTANQVIKRLTDTARKADGEIVPNDQVGYGIVSPRSALQSTAPPGPADVNPLADVRGITPTPTPSSAPPSAQPAPVAGDSASSPPSSPAPAVESADGKDDSDSNLLPLAAIGGGVVVLIALAALYFRSRRGRGTPPPPPMPPAPPRGSW